MTMSSHFNFDLLSRHDVLYFLRIAVLILGYVVVRPLIEASFRRFMPPPQSQEVPDKLREKQKANPRQKSLADELLVDAEDAAEVEEDNNPSARLDHHKSSSAGRADEWGGTLRRGQKARFLEAWEEEQARLAEAEELRELDDILED